ncbi:MAG: hypothetical protein ABDH18_04830 [Aquificaceae bacterium]
MKFELDKAKDALATFTEVRGFNKSAKQTELNTHRREQKKLYEKFRKGGYKMQHFSLTGLRARHFKASFLCSYLQSTCWAQAKVFEPCMTVQTPEPLKKWFFKVLKRAFGFFKSKEVVKCVF